MSGIKSISNTFVINTVEDGTGVPYIRVLGTGFAIERDSGGAQTEEDVQRIRLAVYNGKTAVELKLNDIQADATTNIRRGIALFAVRKSDFTIVEKQYYDTYYDVNNGTTRRAALLAAINSHKSDCYIALSSRDAYWWSQGLSDLLVSLGGKAVSYSSYSRVPFAFVGFDGVGEGQARQVTTSDASDADPAVAEAQIAGGDFIGKNGEKGDKGDTGKTGKGYYYLGEWNDNTSKVYISNNTSIIANDYETPFVSLTTYQTVNEQTVKNVAYKVYIGENISTTRANLPASLAPTVNNSPYWDIMATDFKFLISEAIFTDFARLGKWYFNNDYQFSEYGKNANGEEVHYGESDGQGGVYIFYGHGDSRNNYTPNTYMDAKTGRIYTQTITLQGVMNNLIQIINSTNKGFFGYDDGLKYYINPLNVGQYILFEDNVGTGSYLQINLPIAYAYQYNGVWYTKFGGKKASDTRFTLEEMRMMVGKKIYILPKSINSELRISFYTGDGEPTSTDASLLLVKQQHYGSTTGNDDIADLISEGRYTQLVTMLEAVNNYPTTGNQQFYILECKVGRYHGSECIYWELEATGQTLSGVIEQTQE